MNKLKMIIILTILLLNHTVVYAESNHEEIVSLNNAEKQAQFLASAPVNVKKLYLEQPFMLGDEWFDENGELYPITDVKVEYLETSTYINSRFPNQTISRQRVLTADEYKNWTPVQTRWTCSHYEAADCWETNAKRLLIIYQSFPIEQAKIINQWKTIPKIKSFDTIGVIYNNFTLDSATGRQWYNTSSDPNNVQFINYGFNGTNMNLSLTGQKGVSISQNIINSVYSVLQNDLYVNGTRNYNLQMNGSYQHAVTDIDLATSKNFDFSVNGMGGVFYWYSSWTNWDGMHGVCINWASSTWICD